MTTDQVASLFGRKKKTIQNWVSLGKLPFVEHKNIIYFKLPYIQYYQQL
ncbi:helix-turn-helix domain-containing protein [Candidatus Neomarinimicrobiota bacterium]